MNQMNQAKQESRWLEISAGFICWIGITGLILLITYSLSQSTWAADTTTSVPKISKATRQAASAPVKSPTKSGFMPGTRALSPGQKSNAFGTPTGGNPMGYGNPGGMPMGDDDDEEDYDDLEDYAPRGMPPGMNQGSYPPNPQYPSQYPGNPSGPSHNSGSPRTFSAGGAQENTPDPIRTNQGISVGGTSPNGVISKSKVAPINIDNETAEGSKDLVTDFNFPDADILDIAKTLGKLTGKNFILDKDVKGKITIISNSAISVGEAWKVFLTALDINGFALIPSGKYLRIARQRDARDKQLKTYTGDFSPDTDALITRVFSLKYITAEEVARTFRSFMPANSRIIPYEQTNTIIVTDTGSNISKLSKMLDILDVEGYDAGIEVVPVKYASAAELSKLIDALIPGTSGGTGAPGGAPRFGGGGLGGKFSARRTKEGGIINTIIADERTNTLIVHANTKGADQVRELVAKLDQKIPTSTGGGKVHVVYLQFADAEQIANTLNNFSTQSGPKTGAAAGGTGTGTGSNPVAASLFEGSIRISPDKATNSLVITASPSDFVTVQRVINRLDIPREQVYVEVIVMEVGISKGFDFSANVVSTPSLLGSITNKDDLTGLFTNPLGSNGTIIGFPLGSPTSITIGNQTATVSSVMGLIKFIQRNTNTNILATPQIVALDNTEATFESSEKIPVSSGSTFVPNVGSQQNITKEPVTLSIKIKPQINKITNFVKLEVLAKLGEIQSGNVPPALASQTFASQERTAQTTVVVGDSDSIVLGGLIRDKNEQVVTKVPLLGDIPLLGWLFKSKSVTATKTNLLIFMTPHIIRQYDKIRAVLDRKLKERDEFIETNAGGEDPLRPQRDAMIRGLPDLKDLQKKPNTTITIDEDKLPVPSEVQTAPETQAAPNTPSQTPPSQTPPGAPLAPTSSILQPAPPVPVEAQVAPPVLTEPATDLGNTPPTATPPVGNP